jgi:hypothetical protein
MTKSGLFDDIYVENGFKLEDNGSINSKYPESVPRSKARYATVIPFYPKTLLHGIMVSLFPEHFLKLGSASHVPALYN